MYGGVKRASTACLTQAVGSLIKGDVYGGAVGAGQGGVDERGRGKGISFRRQFGRLRARLGGWGSG